MRQVKQLKNEKDGYENKAQNKLSESVSAYDHQPLIKKTEYDMDGAETTFGYD